MNDERHDSLIEQERWTRDAIRSTGDVCADEAFRERLKREFKSGTISEPTVQAQETESRGFPRWTWLLVPAAAAVVIIAVLLPSAAPTWSVASVHGEGQVEIDGQLLSTGDHDLVARALLDGGRVRVPEGVFLDLRLDDRLILSLDHGADVTLPAPAKRGAEQPLISEIRDGELRIKTGPGFPGTTMRFLTSEGLTEIVGTIISVYKGDGYTCICVLEGTARVGTDEASLEDVPPGMLKIMFGDEMEPMVTDISSEHEAELLEFGKRHEDVFDRPE
jgi:ferric-dicitrate binding protein FerR (iron transport regulator)